MNKSDFKREDCLILIVDDDRTMRNLLKIAMEEEGYRAIEAKNGDQCLQEYKNHKPNLVLLDAIMPEMDGFTCCQKLRSLEDNNNLPILMITALDDQDSIDQAFAAGATDYITKPIFWSVLSQRVNYLLFMGQTLKELTRVKSHLTKYEQWQRLEHQISYQWQRSFPIKSLFQDCLEQLRNPVEAERLGIHRMDGKLMAEAIAPGYPSVKTIEWKKITLLRLYQSSYELAETIVLDFSEKIALSEEEKNTLEQLSLKSLTLIPLLLKDKLWGILWIHHCQGSYQWETWEIESLRHLSSLVVISSKITELAL